MFPDGKKYISVYFLSFACIILFVKALLIVLETLLLFMNYLLLIVTGF